MAVDHVALQLGHVDAVGGEAAERLVERGRQVADVEDERRDDRPVVAAAPRRSRGRARRTASCCGPRPRRRRAGPRGRRSPRPAAARSRPASGRPPRRPRGRRPAVSPETTGVSPSSRITPRHWPRACTWLCTVRNPSSVAPGTAIRENWMRRNRSPTMCRSQVGRKWWMSATRPAIELSIGIIARSAVAALDGREDVLERRAGDGLPVGVVPAGTPGGSWRPARPGRRCAGRGGPLGRRRHGRSLPRATVSRPARAQRRHRVGPVLILAAVALVLAALALVLAVVALRRTPAARRATGGRRAARGRPRAAAGGRRAQGGGRRRAAAPLGGAVRRLRRHGRPPAAGPSPLLDDAGHGVVLTSIHGRSEARTYAKNITAWTCEQQLSPEEEEAISHARG